MLEFDGPVRYTIVSDAEDRAVVVNVVSVEKLPRFKQFWTYRNDPIIRRVTYAQVDDLLSITTALYSSDVLVRSYEMDSPFRIVLNLRRKVSSPVLAASPDPRENVRVEPVKEPSSFQNAEAVANADSLVPSLVMQGDSVPRPTDDSVLTTDQPADSLAVLDETVAAIPADVLRKSRASDAVIFKSTGYLAANNRPRPALPVKAATSSRSNLPWIGMAAAVTFITMLLFVFFSQRKQKKVPPRKRKLAHRPERQSRTEVKTGLPPAAGRQQLEENFMQVLGRTLGAEPGGEGLIATSLRGQGATQRQRIPGKMPESEASRHVVTPSTQSRAAAPAFMEIASELELPLAPGKLTEEMAKKQLVGRDGVEFMRNIKRLHLN